MIIFTIYDKLGNISNKDFIQQIDNLELLKRDLLSRYRKLISDKNIVELDRIKDHNLLVYGEIKNGVITLYSKDKMLDISLTSFLGIDKEVKTYDKSN